MPIEDIRENRIKKLEELKKLSIDPYPDASGRTHTIADALEMFTSFSKEKKEITLSGRLRGVREHGGAVFADLEDGSGRIQIFVRLDEVGEKNFDIFNTLFDIGDFAEVTGILLETKTKEKTLLAKSFRMLSKSLRPLPEKWHGLQDTEEKLRRRYLDLLFNSNTRELFHKKNKFWASIRSHMSKNGFLEVETPVLEAVPGGADAEPFITHLNALDIDLYLRISLELPLKRLLVGGYEKIFEIGRIFRNEGIDAQHLQDYTQMEFYWAYQDLVGLKKFVHELYQKAVSDVLGSLTSIWKTAEVRWEGEWSELDYFELFKNELGIDLETVSRDEIFKSAYKHGFEPEEYLGRGKIIDLLFKKKILPKIIQPSFLLYPPVDIEPLAKRLSVQSGRALRLQVVACGMELGKGFSELNDPLDQRQRFEEQMRLREQGDKEAQRLDEDFLEALEYGMPPSAGFGMSERLFAVLMDKPVRESVFFPLMRPKND